MFIFGLVKTMIVWDLIAKLFFGGPFLIDFMVLENWGVWLFIFIMAYARKIEKENG